MAIIKGKLRPEGINNYADVVHLETSADQIVGLGLFGTTSGTNTYTVAMANVSSLYAGLRVTVKFIAANTGASTLNVNGLGARAIVKAGGTALSSGNLKANGVYTLVYDGVNFQLQGEGASGNATASDLLSGKTATTDVGNIIGTMANRGAVVLTPSTINQPILAGFHSGGGYVEGDPDLKAENIKKGVNIFGVVGNLIDAKGGVLYRPGTGLYTNWERGIYYSESPVYFYIDDTRLGMGSNYTYAIGYFVHKQAIDLTDIQYIVLNVTNGSNYVGWLVVGIDNVKRTGSTSDTTIPTYDHVFTFPPLNNISYGVVLIDVSTITGLQYIHIGKNSNTKNLDVTEISLIPKV